MTVGADLKLNSSLVLSKIGVFFTLLKFIPTVRFKCFNELFQINNIHITYLTLIELCYLIVRL